MSNENSELKPCPSCGFGRAQYDAHVKVMHGVAGSWETYSPKLLTMLSAWYVSCQNCGFTVTWDGRASKADTVHNWNQLPRPWLDGEGR